MDTKWAEENLQTIRTLMERSAVYRRALAPIMLFVGALGIISAVSGLGFHLESMREFLELWLVTAFLAIAGAFFIARRQAIKEKEPFWSPPTRRVGQALLPPLLTGMCLGLFPFFANANSQELRMSVTLIWVLFYGLALHAAGFFMPRGTRLFGWFFVIGACGIFYAAQWTSFNSFDPHWLMGFFFGFLHLAYGAYLYLTEKRKNAA